MCEEVLDRRLTAFNLNLLEATVGEDEDAREQRGRARSQVHDDVAPLIAIDLLDALEGGQAKAHVGVLGIE